MNECGWVGEKRREREKKGTKSWRLGTYMRRVQVNMGCGEPLSSAAADVTIFIKECGSLGYTLHYTTLV